MGLVSARVPIGALRLLVVVMVVLVFFEDYLLKREEKGNLSAKICGSLLSVARASWMRRSLTCCPLINLKLPQYLTIHH